MFNVIRQGFVNVVHDLMYAIEGEKVIDGFTTDMQENILYYVTINCCTYSNVLFFIHKLHVYQGDTHLHMYV